MRYTAIADISKIIVKLLKQGLVPELVKKSDSIGICSPDNKGDFVLGVYLYNIKESESIRISGRRNEEFFTQKYPPVVLDLYYMITPYLKGDIKYIAEEEQILLGRVIQIINDNSNIYRERGEEVTLELCSPALDDRYKIWNSSAPYRTSLFVAARAVILESARNKQIARVTDITITDSQK